MNLNVKLNFSLKDLSKLKLDARYLFLIALLIVLVLDALAIKTSLDAVFHLQAQTAPPPTHANAGVRIDFEDYNKIVQRIEDAKNYQPVPLDLPDPFDGKGTGSTSLTIPLNLVPIASTTAPNSTTSQ